MSAYQAEMDVLAAWMNDCCVVKKHCETKAADLYASYCAWCEQSGEFAEKQRKFGMRLKERGFDNFLSTGGYSKWKGIGLRSVDEVDEVDQKRQKVSRDTDKLKNSRISSTRSTSSTSPPASVDSLPALSPDALTLASVLRLYRGWAEPDELARKSGLGGIERTLTAAQELANAGLALIEGGMVKPTARLMEARP